MGLTGLTIASDIGIVIQTLSLAILLHRRKLVPLSGIELGELGRTLLAASVALVGVWAVTRHLHLPHSHTADIALIGVGTLIWAALGAVILRLTGSRLLQQLLARF